MDDLAIIIVSANSAHWLRPCLRTVFDRAGGASLDVVVAENESTDGTAELVRSEFPLARVVACKNRGFAHGNNRALMTCDARYVLFLNPDTEIREGTFGDLVAAMDARPELGLAGVVQLTGDGQIFPTIRRFPNALRAFGEALLPERVPGRLAPLRERELDLRRYADEVPCDWTTGSFMVTRREALESAGYLDERFFMYSEETDLCLRIKQSGWDVRHLPVMTIVHHGGNGSPQPRLEAQNAYSRVQYARKHFSPLHRVAYTAALAARYALRAALPGGGTRGAQRRLASRHALRVLAGLAAPPFGAPPRRAVSPRAGV